jgi:hypothetical protein
MTQTLDVWRCHQSGELTIVATGMIEPPSVANLDTEASIVLRPAKVDTTMARFGLSPMHDAAPHNANGWWGFLAGHKDVAEARLAITLDGQIRFATVRWPERPQPQPQPQPAKRKSRGRPRKQVERTT